MLEGLNEQSSREMIASSPLMFLILLLLYTGTIHGQQEHVTEGCKYEMLSLSCSPGFIIDVTKVELGETGCYNWQCCPSTDDCTRPASQRHTRNVYSQCNGRNNCRVQAVMEPIDCNGNSESEIIEYYCVQQATIPSTSSSSSLLSPSFVVFSSPSSILWTVLIADNRTALSSNNSSKQDHGYDDDKDTEVSDAADEGKSKAHNEQQGRNTYVVIAVTIIIVTLILVGIAAAVIFLVRRRNRLMKSGLNNGDVSVGFRQLDASERHQDAIETSDEPVYELETLDAGDRVSQVPLVTENVYSEPISEQVTAFHATDGLYNEPQDWNKVLYGAMKPQTKASSGDLIANDVTGNEYDGVLYKSRPEDPANHVYGNIDADSLRQVNELETDVYSDATPWNEAAYGAVGMKPLHPESEYMIPNQIGSAAVGAQQMTSSPPCSDSVYYAMDRRASEQSM